MNYNQNHKKKQRIRASYVWAGVMSVCAVAVVFIAVWVVITVYEKIAGDSTEWAQMTSAEETSELEIDSEEIYGWITDGNGSRYREADGSFAVNQWKIWEDKLYYLNNDGYMATEEVRVGGQVFSFREDGALQDIRLDKNWIGLTGDDNLQNLDSLVKSNEFWCYLSSDPAYSGSFKPICYRKTTETKEEVLGGSTPERSTANSMQIHHGYIYYLPQVSDQQFNRLSLEEQQICNKLYRMKPGESKKELLAESATGYLVLEDGSVYYASGNGIQKVNEANVYTIGEEKYRVMIRDNGAYLVDSAGTVVTGNESKIQVIEDRVYELENGRISDVYPGEQRINHAVFTLEPDPLDRGKNAIFKQEDGGSKSVFLQAPLGINSFCIAEGKLYCSIFAAQGEDNTRYSEIYRINPDGSEYEQLSGRFEGNILNLYYYKEKQKIYGEYTPVSWKSCYGQIISLDFDGTIYVIDDSASRGNLDKNSNELIKLLMVDTMMVTAYLQNCEYSVSKGGWDVLSEKPFQFADNVQNKLCDPAALSPKNPEESVSGEEQESSEEEHSPQENEREVNRNETQEGRTNQRESQGVNNQRETQSERNNQRESQGGNSQRESQGERNTQRETQGEQSAPRETSTAPEVPKPAPTISDTPSSQPDIVPPAEPGTPAPAPESQNQGNTVPTVEANPAQEISPGGSGSSPSQDIQYIGPGGPLG